MSVHENKKIRKITVPYLKLMKSKGKVISALTAYDALTAKILERAGVDIILVGDSLGMVFAGMETTLPVTIEQVLYHTQSVSRGVSKALLVADMPFMSYQVSPEQAIENAGKLVKEGNAQAVKIEGGKHIVETAKRLIDIGIPVVGHLGLTPQSVNQFGGYGLRAKSDKEANNIFEAAGQLDKIDIAAIVLEKIPSELAGEISKSIEAPTIGIGAGNKCDGKILVTEDLLLLFDEFEPKFVRRYANLAIEMEKAIRKYVQDVEKRDFPNADESY